MLCSSRLTTTRCRLPLWCHRKCPVFYIFIIIASSCSYKWGGNFQNDSPFGLSRAVRSRRVQDAQRRLRLFPDLLRVWSAVVPSLCQACLCVGWSLRRSQKGGVTDPCRAQARVSFRPHRRGAAQCNRALQELKDTGSADIILLSLHIPDEESVCQPSPTGDTYILSVGHFSDFYYNWCNCFVPSWLLMCHWLPACLIQ